MALLTLELGSEAHTTSWGSVRATMEGNPFRSEHIVRAERNEDGYTVFLVDLPPDTHVEIVAKGASGPRGCNHDYLSLIIEITRFAQKWYLLAAGPHERRLAGHFKVIRANQQAIHYLGLSQHYHKRKRRVKRQNDGANDDTCTRQETSPGRNNRARCD